MSGASEPLRPVTTELAALAVGVTRATIRKWASRGKITRYGSPGRAIYDLDELMAIAIRRNGGAPLPGSCYGEKGLSIDLDQ
ncbi:transcriptional regulator [Streptomyces mayteni]